jgi:hypothetical protein
MAEMMRIDQPLNRLPERNASTDEDRRDDEVAGALLRCEGAHEEGDPQRHRGQRISEVVDQVGEERDAAGEHEHSALHQGGDQENEQTPAERHTNTDCHGLPAPLTD